MTGFIQKPPDITQLGNHPISRGIIGAWPMTETSDAIAPRDVSGGGQHASYNGANIASVGGRYGSTKYFADSAGDALELGGSTKTYLDYTKPWSFSIVLQWNSYGTTSYARLCNLKTSDAGGYIIFSTADVSYQYMSFGNATNRFRVNAGSFRTLYQDGNPHLLTVTFDGVTKGSTSSYRVYLDGVSQVLVGTASHGTPTNENYIGGSPAGGNEWDGTLENIIVWDKKLTQAEVSLLAVDPYLPYRKFAINQWISATFPAGGGLPWKRNRINSAILAR